MKWRSPRGDDALRPGGALFGMPDDECRMENSRHSSSRGFTLVEMILVMALLVIAVSFVAPRLGGFFRGRTLKSEARQIVSLMHEGQSRAVSAGVPMVLWFDTKEQKYGLEEEPGYADKDPDAVEFKLNENLQLEIPESDPGITTPGDQPTDPARAGLPQINFLPDGTIAETSPQTVKIVDHDSDSTVSLTQTRDRSQYEIATTTTE
jgi:prepilin-type N-terminal cleavage/methylation domain-containing protein